MAPTVFYSWQSDSDPNTNHRFLNLCLQEALELLVNNGHLDEAPRLDHDMKGVHGDADVVPTILRKIDTCDVFVADVTIVAQTEEGKNIPNPNVLLELGYAYKAAGAERIIKVINTAYGDPSEGLPFDLAHKRWPYSYHLPAGTAKKERVEMQHKVAKDLSGFILGILEAEGEKEVPVVVFNEAAPALNSSSFTKDGDLGNYEHPAMDESMSIFLDSGPQWFLRVIPKDSTELSSAKLFEHVSKRLLPFGGQHPSWMVNKWGAASFEMRTGDRPTRHVSQLFRTGELWGIQVLPDNFEEERGLPFPNLRNAFVAALPQYLEFLENTVRKLPPLKIIAGVSGVDGFSLLDARFGYNHKGGRCTQREIIHKEVFSTFEADLDGFLSCFFQKVWEDFTLSGPWDKGLS
jgi:hypothetical protein